MSAPAVRCNSVSVNGPFHACSALPRAADAPVPTLRRPPEASRQLAVVPSPPQNLMRCDLSRPGQTPRFTRTSAPRAPPPLRNLGNTCYLNATMQCVLHTPGLIKELACVWAQPTERQRPAVQALLGFDALTIANLGNLLTTVKGEAAKMNGEFSGNQQADAHEFLRTFLHVLHDETNRRAQRKEPYQELKDVENEGEEAAMRRWQEYLIRVNNSVIYDIYGGVVRSKCICLECGHKSLTFDPFLDLSLPMPSTVREPLSIESLIRSNFYDLEERLHGSNQLHCTKCKRLCDGQRFVKVMKWPKILVVHLKRFRESGRRNGAPVIYPKSFMIPSSQSKTYQLYGVVCHHGSESWGHYTSYVSVPTLGRNGTGTYTGSYGATSLPDLKRFPPLHTFGGCSRDYNEEYGRSSMPCESWYLCNDANITCVNEADVTRALTQAYILFYAESQV